MTQAQTESALKNLRHGIRQLSIAAAHSQIAMGESKGVPLKPGAKPPNYGPRVVSFDTLVATLSEPYLATLAELERALL